MTNTPTPDDKAGGVATPKRYTMEQLSLDAGLYKFEYIKAEDHDRIVAALQAKLAEVERLVYVPGLWSCAKCKLVLVTSTLYAATGQIAANNSPQQCANGCGPMWRVTYKDESKDLLGRLESKCDEAQRLQKKLDDLDRCYGSGS